MRRCERRRKRERTESKENVAVTLSNENEVIEKVAVPTIRTKVVTEQVAHVLTEKHAESFDTIHWIGGIHSFVWSTKTFLYNIWKPISRH